VLTTRTMHWFIKRGFQPVDPNGCPRPARPVQLGPQEPGAGEEALIRLHYQNGFQRLMKKARWKLFFWKGKRCVQQAQRASRGSVCSSANGVALFRYSRKFRRRRPNCLRKAAVYALWL
jgi:hypothetical protein